MLDRDQLIGAEAREVLATDAMSTPDVELDPLLMQRNRTLKTLDREADSLTRVGVALLAWLAAVVGVAGLGALVWNGAPIGVRLLGLVAGLALITGSVIVGRRVWLAGREVTDAYVWWMTMPGRLPSQGAGVEGWRGDPVRDAIETRVWVFGGLRPLRVALVALSALSPAAFGVSLQDSPRFGEVTWDDGQGATITVVVLGLLVVGLGTATIGMGGLWRASSAQAQRDPVWRAISGRLRRR